MKTIYGIILAILIIFVGAYVALHEYRLNKLVEEMHTYNNYAEDIKNLESKTEMFKESFNNLYSTLSNVIEQESKKNEALQSKVTQLDKLTKSDPQLLKKYSKVYFLNENYAPASTEKIPNDYILNTAVEYRIHTNVLPFLTRMIDDSRKEGIEPLIVSAYRSFNTQEALKAKNKLTYGAATANKFVADQGYSEHQLGTTVDFATRKMPNLYASFDTTTEFAWLQKNAHRYGFILSYPKANTYYAYEPWHWRFVGVELATLLHQDSLYFYNLDQKFIDNHLIKMFD